MDWKDTPPAGSGFYLSSTERRGDHVRHWDGAGWSTPLDLRDCTDDALNRLARGNHRSNGGVEWLCPAVIACGLLEFPGGLQPVPNDVQVQVYQLGIMYQGHAGGFAGWSEPCSYTLMEPPKAPPMRDVRGLDAAGLLEASAQYMREGGPRRMSAQDMARITRAFNQLFGTALTETHAWALLAMAEVLGSTLPDEQRNKA